MATEDVVGSDREGQAEVDAVLAETGVTMDQVKRWRREGLLPDVVQDQQAYRGSVVLYPKGTCAQIRAASALFKQKNRVDYVGVRLWRLGFSVDEEHWRPRLQQQGRMLDRVFPFLMRLANAPEEEIARARDDLKNSVAIGFYLYEANRWIYGDGAFGLRLLAWIARKPSDVLVDSMILLMFRLRAVTGAIRPSDEIAELAQ